MQKEQGLKLVCQDEYEFYPLYIRSFQVEDAKKIIFCDIKTMDGDAKNVPVFKDDIQPEIWLSAVIGYESALCDIGWTSRTELNKYINYDVIQYHYFFCNRLLHFLCIF